jgi:DNA polymerase III delta prime subunit
MTKPVLNPTSEKQIAAVIKKTPQSMLLTGENGVGLVTVAKYIAENRGAKPQIILPEKDEKIDLDKGVISVEIMRRLYEESGTKTTSDRIIIIDYAERMTVQAQNAFLKLLEEPSVNTYFMLLSHAASKMLPTILSRAERLEVRPISRNQSEKLLDTLGVKDSTKRSQMLFMADGLPAELTRLSSDDMYFDCMSGLVRDARELLRGNTYQKLLLAQKYKDDRYSTLILLTNASKILKKSLSDNPTPETIQLIDKLLRTYQRIEANGNIRLCLAMFAI